jgi:hypothetical protein
MPALTLFGAECASLAATPALRPIAERLDRAYAAALASGTPEADVGLLDLVSGDGEVMGLCWLLDSLPPGLACLCVRDPHGSVHEGLGALEALSGGSQASRAFCRLRLAVLPPMVAA